MTLLRAISLCLTCAALPAAAQDVPSPPDALQPITDAAAVRALLADADAVLEAGGEGAIDRARALVFQANDIAVAADGMAPDLRYLPNLQAARLYAQQYNWPEVERFALSPLRALDTPEMRLHPLRLEAAGLLGRALIQQERSLEAVTILRPLIAQLDREGGVTGREAALAEFWLGKALAMTGDDGAEEFGLRVFGSDADQSLIGMPEYLSYFQDYVAILHDAHGVSEQLLELSTAMAQGAREAELTPSDRAYILEYHARILNEMGRSDEAVALLQEEMQRLEAEYKGDVARNRMALGLVLAMAQTGQLDDALTVINRTVAEIEALDGPLSEAHLSALRYLLGYAGDIHAHLGDAAAAQQAYRASYEVLRRFERPSSEAALDLAAKIDRADPGFAAYAFAGELADPAQIAVDGPPEAVLARFLSGQSALNDRVFRLAIDRGTVDALPARMNRALHLALSGRRLEAESHIAIARVEAGPKNQAVQDQLSLYSAIAGFWLNGRRPQDDPVLFAELDGLEARLPADQASLVIMLRTSALNFDGRSVEARAELRRWVAQRDLARRPRSEWDIAAAIIGTELGFLFLEDATARKVLTDSQAELSGHAGMELARDYLNLVRLMNADGDLVAERGLAEVAALVQRISAQVPEGHILRATPRFGLAQALWAQGRLPEARDMMAEAAEAYSANPTHRADVLAFLLVLQAQVLSAMGQGDLALNMARAAYDGLPPDARADYRMGVVSVLGMELVKIGRAEEALAISEAELSRPEVFGRLHPSQQVEALRTRARMLLDAGQPDRAIPLLEQAQALVTQEAAIPRATAINLTFDRAMMAWQGGDLRGAYDLLIASNDAWFAERRRLAAESGFVPAEGLQRAQTEAALGWEMYQAAGNGQP